MPNFCMHAFFALLNSELSLYELHRSPQEAITDDTEIAVSPRSLHSELMCPICLDMLKNTYTTKECLHRFCQDCIITALRSGWVIGIFDLVRKGHNGNNYKECKTHTPQKSVYTGSVRIVSLQHWRADEWLGSLIQCERVILVTIIIHKGVSTLVLSGLRNCLSLHWGAGAGLDLNFFLREPAWLLREFSRGPNWVLGSHISLISARSTCTSRARSAKSLRPGSRARLRALEALGFLDALWCILARF